MHIELHLLQNFAPSCLNRDDLNSPKDCQFGGVRRARISSQCQKRAIRMSQEFQNSLEAGIGTRTKYLGRELTEALIAAGKESQISEKIGATVAEIVGSGAKNGRTSVALYLGADEISRIAEAILPRFSEMEASVTPSMEDESDKPKGKKPKKDADSPIQQLAKDIIKNFNPGTRAADIALFGRMIADSEHFNVDAACQVAHALSTHAVSPELDFFTAVDDLQPKSDPGAGMLGTQEFNSPSLYRYVNVNLRQLVHNLNGDAELAKEAVIAFVKAAVLAIPSAKQNSHAAHQLPDFALCTVRTSGPLMALSNAFAKPIKPSRDKSITAVSAEALSDYWAKLNNAYGGISEADSAWYGIDIPDELDVAGAAKMKGLADTLDWLREKLNKSSDLALQSEGKSA